MSGIDAMMMRGGTSKGLYFLKEDLPENLEERDRFLLRVMGSPDARQIDGVGGADPLTSKVAIIAKSARAGIDIDYLFLQVFVDQAIVSSAQNCGNILAGVGPFALERGLITASGAETEIAIYMENTGQTALATIETPNGTVHYDGSARLDGVPNGAAPIALEFLDTAGSMCGALLPTGNPVDEINGISVSLIDNGMPCVILSASEMGISGYETREALDANDTLKKRLEELRLLCGARMNLGDVSQKSVPKMTLVSPPRNAGVINTRSFIPRRCHASIGVLAAVTVATACLLEGSPAHQIAKLPIGAKKKMPIEHPIGATEIIALMEGDQIKSTAILRTARKLFDGRVF